MIIITNSDKNLKSPSASQSAPSIANPSPLPSQICPAPSPSDEPINVSSQVTDNPDNKYSKLDIESSNLFLALFDPYIKKGIVTLHPWQVETNDDISFAQTRDQKTKEIVRKITPTSLHPYKIAICAANGSGKDAFVIAVNALWFIVTKIQSKVILTSASGDQLRTQTEVYIKELARNVNVWHLERYGFEILKINQRHVECILTGGHIYMFATDEGEKAEGHHPTTPISEMMIIVNEAKSVNEEIFQALRRCTGYNYLIYISSPGEPKGTFHKACTTWPNFRRVSYFDCPHQSPDEFELDRQELGEYSFLFRSKWLALFTYIGGNYVVSKEQLDNLRSQIKQSHIKKILQARPKRIGIDIALSDYGDESSISVWQGNVEVDKVEFRYQNAIQLADAIEMFLLKHVKKAHNHIFADDGGVGRAVIDILNERGWRIIRVLNNSAAKNKKQYKNRGAQLWYKFARFVEKNLIILLEDEKSYQQLASRKYKTSDANATVDKLQLQSKREMIAQGINSPDRADAKILAFTDSSLSEFLEADKVEVSDRDKLLQGLKTYNREDIKMLIRRGRLGQDTEKGPRIGFSMAIALKAMESEYQLEDKFQRN